MREILTHLFAADKPEGQQIDHFEHFVQYELPRIIDYYANAIYAVSVVSGTTYKVQITGRPFIGQPCFPDPNKDGRIRLLTPHTARVSGMTYSAPICVPVTLLEDDRVIEKDWVEIGHLPIMVGSRYCHTYGLTAPELIQMYHESSGSKGGYFIVSGSEKVMIQQERLAFNQVLVLAVPNKMKHTWLRMAEIRSVPVGGRHGSRTSNFTIVVKSPSSTDKLVLPDGGGDKTVTLRCKIPQTKPKTEIPIGVLLHALGVQSDEEVWAILGGGDAADSERRLIIKGSITEAHATYIMFEDKNKGTMGCLRNCPDERSADALHIIGKALLQLQPSANLRIRCIEKAQDVIGNEMLCHLATGFSDENNRQKVDFIRYMMGRIWHDGIDSRDHMGYKRLETINAFMCSLLQTGMDKMVGAVIRQLCKTATNPHFPLTIKRTFNFAKKHITSTFRESLASGTWGIKETLNNYNVQVRHGVTQAVSRFTNFTLASQLRKTNINSIRDSNVSAPRELSLSQYGYCDPCETPEGQSCGLIKTMTYSARISLPLHLHAFNLLREYIESYLTQTTRGTKVFLNGILLGECPAPDILTTDLRNRRRRLYDLVPWSASIVHWKGDEDSIFVLTDEGRLVRPLLILPAPARFPRDEINDLLEKCRHVPPHEAARLILSSGLVEYLGADECMANTLIAMDETQLAEGSELFTHMELHPSALYSLNILDIPFSNMNQSVRNAYSASMSKQAISAQMHTMQRRLDSSSHYLHYPQRPICNSSRWLVGDEEEYMSSGTNVVLAINTEFFNQEDSIVLNRAAVDRGLFRSSYLKMVLNMRRPKESLKIPDVKGVTLRKMANYEKLDEEDGLPSIGTHMGPDDVYIGQVVTQKDGTERDISNVVRPSFSMDQGGVVDTVMSGGNPTNDFKFIKTRLRSQKIPEIGDKLSSRHGQKGTIGLIRDSVDMPFTKDGIIPDLIINTHCIPSRMTVGHLKEMLAGKAGAVTGKILDTIPFEGKLDIRDEGFETLYDGETGRKMRTKIFTGCIYYQKLKHMVSDKMQARGTGRHDLMTHQPVEGRNRDGGLRNGEMERDAMVAHGAASFLQDRLFYNSDRYAVPICTQCGMMVRHRRAKCPWCKDKTRVEVKEIPYAMKLLLSELLAMNTPLRLR